MRRVTKFRACRWAHLLMMAVGLIGCAFLLNDGSPRLLWLWYLLLAATNAAGAFNAWLSEVMEAPDA